MTLLVFDLEVFFGVLPWFYYLYETSCTSLKFPSWTFYITHSLYLYLFRNYLLLVSHVPSFTSFIELNLFCIYIIYICILFFLCSWAHELYFTGYFGSSISLLLHILIKRGKYWFYKSTTLAPTNVWTYTIVISPSIIS